MHILDFKTKQANQNSHVGQYMIPDNNDDLIQKENMKKNMMEFVVMQKKLQIAKEA